MKEKVSKVSTATTETLKFNKKGELTGRLLRNSTTTFSSPKHYNYQGIFGSAISVAGIIVVLMLALSVAFGGKDFSIVRSLAKLSDTNGAFHAIEAFTPEEVLNWLGQAGEGWTMFINDTFYGWTFLPQVGQFIGGLLSDLGSGIANIVSFVYFLLSGLNSAIGLIFAFLRALLTV